MESMPEPRHASSASMGCIVYFCHGNAAILESKINSGYGRLDSKMAAITMAIVNTATPLYCITCYYRVIAMYVNCGMCMQAISNRTTTVAISACACSP